MGIKPSSPSSFSLSNPFFFLYQCVNGNKAFLPVLFLSFKPIFFFFATRWMGIKPSSPSSSSLSTHFFFFLCDWVNGNKTICDWFSSRLKFQAASHYKSIQTISESNSDISFVAGLAKADMTQPNHTGLSRYFEPCSQPFPLSESYIRLNHKNIRE